MSWTLNFGAIITALVVLVLVGILLYRNSYDEDGY